MLVFLVVVLASGLSGPLQESPQAAVNIVDRLESQVIYAQNEELEVEIERIEREVERCMEGLTIAEIRQLPNVVRVEMRRPDDGHHEEIPQPPVSC